MRLARKIKEGEFKKALLSSENVGPVEECIRFLHACRSEAQFDLLGSDVLDCWEKILLEPKFTKCFRRIYMEMRALLLSNMHTRA